MRNLNRNFGSNMGRQIGDVGVSDLIGPVDPQYAQHVRVGLMAFGGLAGIELLIDRHQMHQLPDALFVHGMPLILQGSCHSPDTIDRRVHKLLVDLQHQVDGHPCLAQRNVVKQRSRDRQ